jgi:hypothetical protein
MNKIKSTRSNGKSDRTVLLELFFSGKAGQVYTFDEIGAALSKDSTRVFNTAAVRSAVGASYRALLKEQSRAIHSVRGVGYRLAEASDHNRLAVIRKTRADKQFATGMLTLQQVRWDEMPTDARHAHEGTLMLYSALHQQQRAMESRLSRVENAIGTLLGNDKETSLG